MTKLHLLASVLGIGLVAGAAGASVVVLGSSPGHSCYMAAKAESSSRSALDTCDTALATNAMSEQDTVATHVNRGIIRLHRTDFDGAVADFDTAIAINPDQPESYLNKGSALLRMGRTGPEAVALFGTAIERKTRRPELAYFGRAIAYEVSGDARSAYYDYQRAARAAPKWERPREELTRFTVTRTSG